MDQFTAEFSRRRRVLSRFMSASPNLGAGPARRRIFFPLPGRGVKTRSSMSAATAPTDVGGFVSFRWRA